MHRILILSILHHVVCTGFEFVEGTKVVDQPTPLLTHFADSKPLKGECSGCFPCAFSSNATRWNRQHTKVELQRFTGLFSDQLCVSAITVSCSDRQLRLERGEILILCTIRTICST